jgi:hypothetical protein
MAAQVLVTVIPDGTGGAAFEAAPRTVIEIMSGDFHRQGQIPRHFAGELLPLIQSRF